MTVICTVDLPDEEEIDLTDTNGLDEIILSISFLDLF
jgi:hypothetical protein